VRKVRYERRSAGDRRQELVAAAIESLKRHGHDGLSVRRIAARAGVSIGLINHHFPNKDALVAESYRRFSRELSAGFQAAVERAPREPRARLSAFIEAVFSKPNLDPQVLTAWVVFWGLFRQSPEIRRAHREEGRGYGALPGILVKDLLKGAGKSRFQARVATIGLTAMLDGLWLEWCLDPRGFRPNEAVALCEDWIDSRVRASGP
jgi:AcrR family transcriptional regulator